MQNNFKTYQLAIKFYHTAEKLIMPSHLKEQFRRASASIVLNLAEGGAKPTVKDKRKFYFISLGSLRECQAILALCFVTDKNIMALSDHLGASLYKLCNWKG